MKTHSHLHLSGLDETEPRPVRLFLKFINHETGNVSETLLLLETCNEFSLSEVGQFRIELPVRIDLNILEFQVKREFEVGTRPKAIGSIDSLGLQGCYNCL